MRFGSKFATRKAGRLKNNAVYVALGVTPEGEREFLGLWIAVNEEAKFWLSAINNLRNQGFKGHCQLVLG